MLIPIDAVRSGMGFDHVGCWHKARTGYIPARRWSDEPVYPGRGVVLSLLVSGTLWVGIIAGVRALIHLF